MTFAHRNGFSCGDAEDRIDDLERELGAAHRSLVLVHTWLGRAMEQKAYRGDMLDAEQPIIEAYTEADKATRIR